MWRNRELNDIEKSRMTSCTVVRRFSDQIPHNLGSVDLSFYTPEYSRLYKRFLDTDLGTAENNNAHITGQYSSDGQSLLWKPCQSYTRSVVPRLPPGFDTDSVVPWWSQSVAGYYPGYWVNTGGIDPLVVAGYRTFTDRFGAFGQHNAGLPSMTESNIGTLSFVPKPLGLNTLVESSLKAMLPSIKAELSLINSVLELKDFRSLPHTISNVGKTLKNLSRFIKSGGKIKGKNPFDLIRRSFDPRQGLTLREMLHSTSDGYLQAEFNLLPLFSDICAVFRACANTSKRMNKLVSNQGRLQRRHFTYAFIPVQFSGANVSQNMVLQLDQFAGSISKSPDIGCYRALSQQLTVTRECIVQNPAIFHAQIEYNYYFTQYQNEHARLLTLLDSLGVNLDPTIIWNAIPWSFVVDWVIGVNRWLGNRKVLNMEPAVNISRYMWSWKTERLLRTYFQNTSASPPGPYVHRTYLPDLYETIYRRDVELPAVHNSLFGSGLSDSELSLGAALVITRAFHPSRGLSGKR